MNRTIEMILSKSHQQEALVRMTPRKDFFRMKPRKDFFQITPRKDFFRITPRRKPCADCITKNSTALHCPEQGNIHQMKEVMGIAVKPAVSLEQHIDSDKGPDDSSERRRREKKTYAKAQQSKKAT